jgi:prepilin-type N-terminal cleavage/methylation domain-containing protein
VRHRKTFASKKRDRKAQQGFSLIEVMISMVVVTIGLVSLLGVMGIAMAATQTSETVAISKQLANEALESILTARESSNLTWAQIQNTGGGGVFVGGFNPIYNPGVDGIIDTADDTAAGIQTLQLPGPDGIYNTADDQFIPLTNYERQITIVNATDVNGNQMQDLRQVTITVQYQAPQLKVPQNYVLSTFISPYR